MVRNFTINMWDSVLLQLNFLVCKAGNKCSVRAVARTQHVHKTFSTVSGTQGLFSGYGYHHANSQTLHMIPCGRSLEKGTSQAQIPSEPRAHKTGGICKCPASHLLLNSSLAHSKPSLLASLFIPKKSLIHILYLYLKLKKNWVSIVAKNKIHHSTDILRECIKNVLK